jgi:apolipoprotein N-acyltransferase
MLGALVSGLTATLAVAPFSIAGMSFLGLSLLILSLYGASSRIGLAVGFAFGSTFGLVSLSAFIAWDGSAWLAASFLLGMVFGTFGFVSAFYLRFPAWPLWVACTYAVVDYVLGSIDLPLVTSARVAYAQSESILFPLSVLAGPPLIAFVVALLAGLFAAIVISLVERQQRLREMLGVSAIACLIALATVILPGYPSPTAAREITALVVQAGRGSGLQAISGVRTASPVLADSLQWVRAYASQDAPIAGAGPDIVVLPPRSVTAASLEEPQVREALSKTAQRVGAPILLGFSTGGDLESGESRYVLWGPRGPEQFLSPEIHGKAATNDPGREAETLEKAKELVPILRIDGASLGLIEATLAFESPDEMASLRNVQGLILMRHADAGGTDVIESRTYMTSARLLSASIHRPALVASLRGPTGFINSVGYIESWSDRGRSGYLLSTMSLTSEGDLPYRRDSLVFLVFLVAPICFLIVYFRMRQRNRLADSSGSRPSLSLQHPGFG